MTTADRHTLIFSLLCQQLDRRRRVVGGQRAQSHHGAHGLDEPSQSEIVHTVEDAVQRIVSGIEPLSVERVALLDALGRVLATPVASPLTLPAWDNSAMDGYALRASDVEGASEAAPVTLAVLETVAAGAFPSRDVEAGAARAS